jgi:cytoskeletal protein CcmA (bactofilin family)
LQTGALGLGSHSEGADFHLFSLTLKGGKGARNYNITNKSAVKDIEYRLIPGITKVKINNEESINVTGFSGTSVTLDSTLSAQSAFEGAVTFMTYNACGTGSHTEGVGTFVASTPEGETDEEELAGYGAHAEGARTMSLGLGSHAEGSYSIAKGVAAHAEGYNSYAEGRCSHAQGCNTIAIGEMSSASGFNTIASGSIQSVFGKYNIDDTEDQFAIIVGGGENNTKRSNLYTLDWEGTGTFKNNLVVTNDLSALNITATEQLEATNLSVTDSVEIGDALTVTGDATFEGTITGAQEVLFEDSLTVSGESTLNDTLTVNSSASITDDLEVECDLDVHGGIDVSGDVYVTGDIHCENFIGNASTATEFESAETVKLTGDVTGETSSTAGWTVATTLSNSGVTAGSYGPSANATPGHSGTFNVPYITVDAKGRVTSCSTKTITLPSDNNTDTLVT